MGEDFTSSNFDGRLFFNEALSPTPTWQLEGRFYTGSWDLSTFVQIGTDDNWSGCHVTGVYSGYHAGAPNFATVSECFNCSPDGRVKFVQCGCITCEGKGANIFPIKIELADEDPEWPEYPMVVWFSGNDQGWPWPSWLSGYDYADPTVVHECCQWVGHWCPEEDDPFDIILKTAPYASCPWGGWTLETIYKREGGEYDSDFAYYCCPESDKWCCCIDDVEFELNHPAGTWKVDGGFDWPDQCDDLAGVQKPTGFGVGCIKRGEGLNNGTIPPTTTAVPTTTTTAP